MADPSIGKNVATQMAEVFADMERVRLNAEMRRAEDAAATKEFLTFARRAITEFNSVTPQAYQLGVPPIEDMLMLSFRGRPSLNVTFLDGTAHVALIEKSGSEPTNFRLCKNEQGVSFQKFIDEYDDNFKFLSSEEFVSDLIRLACDQEVAWQ